MKTTLKALLVISVLATQACTPQPADDSFTGNQPQATSQNSTSPLFSGGVLVGAVLIFTALFIANDAVDTVFGD